MNPGAQTCNVTLHRDDVQQPWGFRLQGGADFSTPLSVQLVNPGSLAERCDLQAGDAVLSINGKPSADLEHEKAKYEILMAQLDLSLVIQRGAVNIWKPKVTPLTDLKPAELKRFGGVDDDVIIQRTSLAARQQDSTPVGGNYNTTARPFSGFGGGAPTAAPAPAPQKFAPPAAPRQAPPQQFGGGASPFGGQQGGAYGAQTQMAGQAGGYGGGSYGGGGGGGYGVDQPIRPSPLRPAFAASPAQVGAPSQGGGSVGIGGFRSVKAPMTKAPSERAPQQTHPVCAACGGLCVGVFVKINGQPLHPECFKCANCGKNLKNQGHFTIDGKKYCDPCTQQVAGEPGVDYR